LTVTGPGVRIPISPPNIISKIKSLKQTLKGFLFVILLVIHSKSSLFSSSINMTPTIKTFPEKKLIGKRIKMTLADNKTFELWKSFMSRRIEIKNKVSSELFSIRVYDQPTDLYNFNKQHEKWAAIEVLDFNTVPDEMETYILPGGLYAVFPYKGLNTDTSIFQYIYGTWLSSSNYILDSRPHFEIMGEKYKNNDPNSEEEIWVPIKLKA
jgi:AraC family transcriptional regulator